MGNLTTLSCDSTLVINFSHFCLSHAEDFPDNCFPSDEIFPGFRRAVGIWCIVNAVIGSMGNLLTLLAIPYAAKRNK